jgi:tetratricopeptide (TPR) repeat protein
MKKSALFLFLSCSLMVSAQQSDIKGVVSIHNSQFKTGTRQYVQNAQVEDDFGKATPTTTDATGNFKLVFVGADKGKSVVLSIKKAGLQVVNTSDLTAVAGQTDALKISMAHPDSIAEYRKRLYNIGKSEAEKNLYAQLKKKGADIAALQKDAQKNAAAIEKLQHEYGELDKYREKVEEQAQDLARRYAPINLDDAAPLYREAFGYFQQGDLEKAMQILRGADLIGQADKILAERKAIGTIRQEANQRDSLQQQRTKDLLQVLGLKADLHKARFEWDSVRICLELKVDLDSTNMDNLFELAYFFDNQNETPKAIPYYKRAISYLKADDLIGRVCNNLGGAYSDINNMPEAEKYFLQALNIYTHLAKNNPQQFESELATTTMNLGIHYKALNNMPEAEKYFLQTLNIYSRLATKKTQDFEPDLMITANSLGEYYRVNNNMLEAEKYFLQALDIYKRLAKSNLKQFEPNLAKTSINLGNYYFDINNMPEAEKYFLQALARYGSLAKSNSPKFEPDLATAANSLGEYYRVNNNMPEAEKYFLQALDIRKVLVKSNPQKFEPSLATTAMNLGSYYYTANNMPKAEKYYLQALSIYVDLATSNPQQFELDLAGTAMNLGSYYYTINNMPKAEKCYLQSLDIIKRLVKSNPQRFEPDLAKMTMNLGNYYSDINNMPESEKYYLQSLDIYVRLSKNNSQHFESDLALTQYNLGLYYQEQKKYAKAEKYLTSALTIYEKWEKITPSVFGTNRKETWRIVKEFYEEWIATTSTTTEKTALEKKLKDLLTRE